MARKYEGNKIKPSTLRTLCVVAVMVAVVVSFFVSTGWGSLCSIGYEAVAAICPLGAIEAWLASGMAVPRSVIAFLAVLLFVVVFGKAFCGWLCPVPLLKKLAPKKVRERDDSERAQAAMVVAQRSRLLAEGAEEAGSEDDAMQAEAVVGKPKQGHFDSRHVVLAGTLGSAAIFGFPVFCLVCPVGLTFATLIAISRAVGFNELSWGLVVFPVILVLELTVLRRWCGKFCPISALLSLVSHANKTFRPVADPSTCARKGSGCTACAKACPEHIDPSENLGLSDIRECTRCNACAQACPMAAISFPAFSTKVKKLSDKQARE